MIYLITPGTGISQRVSRKIFIRYILYRIQVRRNDSESGNTSNIANWRNMNVRYVLAAPNRINMGLIPRNGSSPFYANIT